MTYKLILIDAHAAKRMGERGFTRSDVRWLLAQGAPFEARQRTGSDARFGRRGLIRGRDTALVYLEDAHRILVITIMPVIRGRMP